MTTECETTIADCVHEWLQVNSGMMDVERLFDFNCLVDQFQITSPPEQLFACVWCLHFLHHRVALEPQHVVGNYRIDFLVNPFNHFVNGQGFSNDMLTLIEEKLPRYAIEIDGFEWHDKTPEQAERDKIRERFIQSQGYTVLRFAAREVLRSPADAAREISFRVSADIRSIYGRLTFR